MLGLSGGGRGRYRGGVAGLSRSPATSRLLASHRESQRRPVCRSEGRILRGSSPRCRDVFARGVADRVRLASNDQSLGPAVPAAARRLARRRCNAPCLRRLSAGGGRACQRPDSPAPCCLRSAAAQGTSGHSPHLSGGHVLAAGSCEVGLGQLNSGGMAYKGYGSASGYLWVGALGARSRRWGFGIRGH